MEKRTVIVKWNANMFQHDMAVEDTSAVHAFEQQWVIDLVMKMLTTADSSTRFEISVI